MPISAEQEGPGVDTAAGDRHRELVAELVAMRRQEAAEEDEEDFAWFSGVREEVLGTIAANDHPDAHPGPRPGPVRPPDV